MCGSVSGIRLIFLRSRAFWSLFEVFLVCAVVSLLLIRGLLALAGFPSIHGGGLHVAHLLWGGLLMLLGLLMLTAFAGRPVQALAMVLAGAGFGTFIDEVGKFVTSDSNYFFRPAVAIAYTVMVLVFLLARAFEGSRTAACVWFERAVLVNLLLGQVFIFYLIQFWALFGLGLDLALLLLLKGSIRADIALAHRHR